MLKCSGSDQYLRSMAFKQPDTLTISALLTSCTQRYKAKPKCNPLRALTIGINKFVNMHKPDIRNLLHPNTISSNVGDFYYNFDNAIASGTFSEIYW